MTIVWGRGAVGVAEVDMGLSVIGLRAARSFARRRTSKDRFPWRRNVVSVSPGVCSRDWRAGASAGHCCPVFNPFDTGIPSRFESLGPVDTFSCQTLWGARWRPGRCFEYEGWFVAKDLATDRLARALVSTQARLPQARPVLSS